MNFIGILIFVLLLFVGENFYNAYKFNYTYHQYVIFLTLLSLIFTIIKDDQFFYRKENKWIFVIIPIIVIIRYIFVGTEGIIWQVFQMFGAFFISTFFLQFYKIKDRSTCLILFLLMIVFYLVDSSIAIYEKITSDYLFGWTQKDNVIFIYGSDETEFRSTALLGHPLQNTLVISTLMTFILTSNIKNIIKYSLWGIGLVAILCFNTRFAIVFNILVLILYLFSEYKSKRKIKTIFVVTILTCFILYAIFYLLSYTSFGGRLLSMGLFDDSSAKARIDVYNIFNIYPIYKFLFPINDASHLLRIAKVMAVENFWINWMFAYGIALLILAIPVLWLNIKMRVKNYSCYHKWLVFGTFVILASTNNSLSASYIPTVFFLLSVHIFDPKNEKYFPSFLLSEGKKRIPIIISEYLKMKK